VTALVFCRVLAGSDATDMPSLMCMGYYIGDIITQLI